MGLNPPRSSTRFFTSGVWPSVQPTVIDPISMTRPNTCAIGRNSSVEVEELKKSSSRLRSSTASTTKLRWVSSQPFGRPVVPDV